MRERAPIPEGPLTREEARVRERAPIPEGPLTPVEAPAQERASTQERTPPRAQPTHSGPVRKH